MLPFAPYVPSGLPVTRYERWWVVVGDAKVVRPQLDTLGLPVEVIPAAAVAGGAAAPARTAATN